MDETTVLTFDVDDFIEEFSHCFTGECRVSVLPILYKISQINTNSADLARSLPIILGVMRQHLKIQRGMVTLYDRHSGSIFIRDSFGLDEAEKTAGAYAPDGAVTAKVVETGKAVVVQRRAPDPEADGTTKTGRQNRRSSACRLSMPSGCSAPSAPSASISISACCARTSN